MIIYKRMESIKQKKCPKCGSENVMDTGNCENAGGDVGLGGSYEVPTIPIYKCEKCDETFTIRS